MHYTIPMLKDEYWWGGTVASEACPLHAHSSYHQDFTKNCENQTMPLFISNQGRVIWSEEPFKVDVENGVFAMEGGEIVLSKEGDTLRQAYLSAMQAHFPCDRKKLPEDFFLTAQYNTWMEFTYSPTQDGVLSFAKGYLDHGFAPGIFILDEGWHGRYGNWEFDFARFPDPKKMVDTLHQMGFKVLLWIVPYVCADGAEFVRSLLPIHQIENMPPLYMRNEEGEVAIVKWWNGFSAVLNLANPRDAQYLDAQLQHLMKDYGVDGFKFDGGTPFRYHNESVMNGNFACDLGPHELNRAWNAFGRRYLYHEYKDTYRGGGQNTIQRLRDKHHRWEGGGIDQFVPCAITCGLIGHPFLCPDMIGGGEWQDKNQKDFKVDPELFVRMAQCSALFPMMQFSWAPWEILDEENLQLCKQAAELHQKLSPIILSLVHRAEETGEPILRTLEYNDPHKGYASIRDEYMLGEDILVAPVLTKGTTKKEVVFPQGLWEDEKGNRYEGRSKQTLPAPLSTLLWFKRAK